MGVNLEKSRPFIIVAIVLFCTSACSDNTPKVEAAIAGLGDICERVPVEGKVRPVKEVAIAAEVSGEIIHLPVVDGSAVSQGDTLLVIRPDAYVAAVESAEASLGMLEAELSQQRTRTALACSTLARVRRLQSGGAASDGEVDAAFADSVIAAGQLLASEYAVKRGEAALREANDNLSRTTLLSPISGIVTYLGVKKGERIVGTSQMAGTVAMTIADLGNMELVATASERDVVKIGRGDSANVTAEALRGTSFKGKVTRIANSAKNIDISFGQVTNFEVRIAIRQEASEDSKRFLRPGMSASASIVTERLENVILIPVQSLFAKGRQEYVWVIGADGRVHPQAITTGIQDLDFIEVRQGLDEGDTVVCGPVSAVTRELDDGMKVRFEIEKK